MNSKKVPAIIALLLGILLAAACGDTATPVPTHTHTPIPAFTPTAEPTRTLAPAPTEAPTETSPAQATSTPAPTRTPPPVDGRFFAPEVDGGDTYEDVFDQLIKSEQDCVLNAAGGLFSEVLHKTFDDYDPDNPVEADAVRALIFDCPTEEGRRHRLFIEITEGLKTYSNIDLTNAERECIRGVIDNLPVRDGRIYEDEEEDFILCTADAVLRAWLMDHATSTGFPITPGMEDCLREQSLGLSTDMGYPDRSPDWAVLEGIVEQCRNETHNGSTSTP